MGEIKILSDLLHKIGNELKLSTKATDNFNKSIKALTESICDICLENPEYTECDSCGCTLCESCTNETNDGYLCDNCYNPGEFD